MACAVAALLAGQAPVSRVAAPGACSHAVQKTVGEKWRAGRNKTRTSMWLKYRSKPRDRSMRIWHWRTQSRQRQAAGGGTGVGYVRRRLYPNRIETVGAHLPGAAGHREKAEQHGCREVTVTLVKPMATSCEVRRVDGGHRSRKPCTRARSKSKAFELRGHGKTRHRRSAFPASRNPRTYFHGEHKGRERTVILVIWT